MNIFMLQLSAYLAVGLWQALAFWLVARKDDEPFGLTEVFICAIMWPIVWMVLAPPPGKIVDLLTNDVRLTIKLLAVNSAIAILISILFRFLV